MIGLLTASLLGDFPLKSLTVVDAIKSRRKLDVESKKLRVDRYSPADLPSFTSDLFDLTFELSGSPSALNTAIALTAFSGRVVIGSWYGQKRAEIDLGGAFHHSRTFPAG